MNIGSCIATWTPTLGIPNMIPHGPLLYSLVDRWVLQAAGFQFMGSPLESPPCWGGWAPEAAGCPKGDLGGNELRMLLYFLSPPFSPILYGFTMLYNGLLGWYFWDLLVTSPVAATEPPGSGAPFRAAGSELFQTTADCLPHDCNVQHEGRFVGLGVGG